MPSWQRSVISAEPLLHSFLLNLASSLVPIFVLGLCLVSWVFSYASRVLLMVLIIGSSYRLYPSLGLHPIELQNNYLQIYLSNLVVLVIKHQNPKYMGQGSIFLTLAKYNPNLCWLFTFWLT